MIKYENTQEPLVLSKYTMDLLIKDQKPEQVIGLYTFYYYTAKWQGTDTIKCVTSYAAKAMKWNKDKLIRVKKRLIEYGLIEDFQKRESGRIKEHYINVKFIWFEKSPDSEKTRLRKNQTLAIGEINALNTNNNKYISKDIYRDISVGEKKIMKRKKPKIKENNKPYIKFSKKLLQIIEDHQQIKMTGKVTKINSWANSFRLLNLNNGISKSRIYEALKFYEKNIGGKYTPIILCGNSFREKFINLENCQKRKNSINKNDNPAGSLHSSNQTHIFNKGIEIK